MDVMLTYSHLESLIDSGYRYFVPVGSGVNDEVSIVLHPFHRQDEALQFIQKTGLMVEPLYALDLRKLYDIIVAIEENRCYIANKASRQF